MKALLDRPLPAAGDWLALLGLLMTTRTGVHLLEGEADSSAIFLAFAGLIYLAVGLTFLRRTEVLLTLIRQNRLLMLLIVLVTASAAWSMDPALSFRRAVALIGTTLLAFYIVDRYTPRQFVHLIGATLLIAALASLFTIVALPEIGIHRDKHFGDWRGLFNHKNLLGMLASLGALLFAFQLRRPRWDFATLGAIAAFVLMLTLVVMSGSRTAWVVTAVGLVSFPLLALLRAHWSIAVPGVLALLVGVLAVGVVLTQQTAELTDALGRDVTLTGRTTLWQIAIAFGMDRPWLGHGYGAFWQGDAGLSGLLREAVGWEVSSAHNAYLDLWLELGFVGAAVFIALLTQILLNLLRRLRDRRDETAIWHALFLISLLTGGTVAGDFLNQNALTWILFVAAGCYLGRGRSSVAATVNIRQPFARPGPSSARLEPG